MLHCKASKVHKPRSINELLKSGGQRLSALQARSAARDEALRSVCAALPDTLADIVVSAGLERGQLTVGVKGAVWAARLRYLSDTLRTRVGSAMGVEIDKVRIKVIPHRS
jgi:hypothetical protein